MASPFPFQLDLGQRFGLQPEVRFAGQSQWVAQVAINRFYRVESVECKFLVKLVLEFCCAGFGQGGVHQPKIDQVIEAGDCFG